ncbi:MAG TPA: HAMP domain-containing protein, partial [Thermoleophilaceae bacterium]|nr:HAMP domain-containing protein [Thermoleophilaceae bacterium]
MNAAPEERSGAELAEAVNRRLSRAAVVANSAGALVVGAFLVSMPLASDPGEAGGLLLRNLAFAVPYLLFTLWAGVSWGNARYQRVHDWLRAGRAPTEGERQAVLRYPRLFSAIGAFMWGTGALLFALVNAATNPEVGLVAGVVTLLGGTTTCALGYLLAERIERPVVALALAEGTPTRPVGPGVRTRLTVAWVLATGVPVLGVIGIGAADLLGADLDEGALDASIVFLAAVALGVGLYATLLAAQSVADPLAALRGAQARVRAGEFDARVAVADGSEVGLLAAGFNDMAAGLAERERLRDLFGRHVGRDVSRAALDDGELRLGGE